MRHALLIVMFVLPACAATATRPDEVDPGPDAGMAAEPDAEPVDMEPADGPDDCVFKRTEAVGELTNPPILSHNYVGDRLRVWFYADSTETREIVITLHDGQGVFADGIKPGTYELTEDDARNDRCVICVRLLDFEQDISYIAQSGLITITSVDASAEMFHANAVELDMAPFKSVDRDDGVSCDSPDDCLGESICNITYGRCGVHVPVLNVCNTSISGFSF